MEDFVCSVVCAKINRKEGRGEGGGADEDGRREKGGERARKQSRSVARFSDLQWPLQGGPDGVYNQEDLSVGISEKIRDCFSLRRRIIFQEAITQRISST